MSVLDFLTPAATTDASPAESPMAAAAAARGATFEIRGGWRIATGFAERELEQEALRDTVAWSDVSDLPKLELQGPAEAIAALAGGLTLGTAVGDGDGWWCPVTPTRVLAIGAVTGAVDRDDVHVVDVTTQFAALRIGGPAARELMARCCALDLRPTVAPPGSFLPGSVARTPGFLLIEAPDRLLVLSGAAVAEYLWTVVADAGERLGGRPVGIDAMTTDRERVAPHA